MAFDTSGTGRDGARVTSSTYTTSCRATCWMANCHVHQADHLSAIAIARGSQAPNSSCQLRREKGECGGSEQAESPECTAGLPRCVPMMPADAHGLASRTGRSDIDFDVGVVED